MHTPSHLAQPSTGHHDDGNRPPIYVPGTITALLNAANPELIPDPVPAVMDRKDQIFVELVRLRRYSVRLKWWQFSERRLVNAEIAALKAEQDALAVLDSIVSEYKTEAGL